MEMGIVFVGNEIAENESVITIQEMSMVYRRMSDVDSESVREFIVVESFSCSVL